MSFSRDYDRLSQVLLPIRNTPIFRTLSSVILQLTSAHRVNQLISGLKQLNDSGEMAFCFNLYRLIYQMFGKKWFDDYILSNWKEFGSELRLSLINAVGHHEGIDFELFHALFNHNDTTVTERYRIVNQLIPGFDRQPDWVVESIPIMINTILDSNDANKLEPELRTYLKRYAGKVTSHIEEHLNY